MKINTLKAAIAVLVLPALMAAQALPVTPQSRKPTLKRDRTQRVLYPKIIQYEDERTANNELVEMLRRRTAECAAAPS